MFVGKNMAQLPTAYPYSPKSSLFSSNEYRRNCDCGLVFQMVSKNELFHKSLMIVMNCQFKWSCFPEISQSAGELLNC